MMILHEKEIETAGLDPKEVVRIARNIEKYAKLAEKLGICVFGGSTGSLRFRDEYGSLILAEMDGSFDGGDGACREDENGLLRGEER